MKPTAVFTIAFVFLLSGCVGVGALVPIVEEEGVSHLSPSTPEEVRAWRDDDLTVSSRKEGDFEVLRVRHENDWCGVFLVVVPLMLPVCENSKEYVFENGVLINTRYRHAEFKGFACSIFPICPGGGNCTLCTTDF